MKKQTLLLLISISIFTFFATFFKISFPKSLDSDIFNSSHSFNILRKKWHEIPAGDRRISSNDLLKFSNEDLLRFHAQSTDFAVKDHREWYHLAYKESFKGKRILDVGCGLGIDGIMFAQNGAHVTFLDIVLENVLLVEKLCSLLNIKNVDFFYMEDLSSINSLKYDFDAIFCSGSLINAPFEIVRKETHELLKHLKPEGRWVELCYPKERWEREGNTPFEIWGEKTDGGAPWMEWYNLEKMEARFNPIKFEVVRYFNFHNDDFNWFDLIPIKGH